MDAVDIEAPSEVLTEAQKNDGFGELEKLKENGKVVKKVKQKEDTNRPKKVVKVASSKMFDSTNASTSVYCSIKHEESCKLDYPSQIDFDPASLPLKKEYFVNYSEGREQEEKVRYLQENFQFLQQQHKHLMGCLHKEVDDLKQKNLALNLKLTEYVAQAERLEEEGRCLKPYPRLGNVASSSSSKECQVVRVLKLTNEVETLKESLAFYKQENNLLTTMLHKYEQSTGCGTKKVVHEDKSSCQTIIKQLNDINQQNVNKLVKLKGDLYSSLNDQHLPLSAFIRTEGCPEKDKEGGLFKKLTLPKLPKFRGRQKKLSLLRSESNQLLPPLRGADKGNRPHFKP